MKVGLFFGSFNPIHVGHLIIANYMAQHTDLEQVWFIVSPHNPLKNKSTLAKDYDRLHWVQLAIKDNAKLRASNIEFNLPKPSYTIDTLVHLEEKYPNKDFVLIMGSDNLISLPKWKNYELLLERYAIYVYKRPSYDIPSLSESSNIVIIEDAPFMQISASFVRKCIKEGKSVQYLLTEPVLEDIDKGNTYR